MEELRRARWHTLQMMVMMLVIMWLFIGMRQTMAAADGHAPSWPRLAPALVASACFTWLYVRVAAGIIDRRYPVKEIVAAAAVAVCAAAIGGGDPLHFGMVLVVWLSIASLGVTRRTAVLMAVGTFVTGIMLSLGNYYLDPSTLLVDDRDIGSVLLFVVPTYAVFCALFPPSNRVWMYMLSLAIQAQEGKEAHTRLALAEERLRFSRDLHDIVGHQLSAIAVKTELAVRLADADAAAAKAEMTEVNTLTRKALRELRQAVRGYRELDLQAELNSVKGVLEAAGVRCRTHLPYRELPEGVAPVFAYVVREAVTNVLKHSAATHCDILVRFTDEEAEISVRNDGVGGWRGEDLGSGLTGLAERVEAVGGRFTAGPAGDGEFVLRAVVSLPIPG
jgi:two-component system sensor histidine kinase DesK